MLKKKQKKNGFPILMGFVFFLFSLNVFNLALGQVEDDYKFDRISTENYKLERGLSQNSANCIMQDSQGFIWVGTWDGLNRYDGYDFLVFKSTVNDEGSEMSNLTVNALHEDNAGRLWIGTENGLSCYNPKNKQFFRYRADYKNPFAISSDTIWCIAKESENVLWIGTNNGLNRLDVANGIFYHFKLNPNNANSPSNNKINCLLVDDDKNIWFGTDKGLNFYDRNRRIFSHWYSDESDANSLSNDIINDLCLDHLGNLWICTNNGLNYLDVKRNRITLYVNDPNDKNSLRNNQTTCVLYDDKNTVWIGTYGGGLNIFNYQTNKFSVYQNDTYNDRSISSDYINALCKDQSGIIWVATAWRGICKIDCFSNRFPHFKHISNNDQSLNNNNVWGIVQDKQGKVWITTDNGVNIYDTVTGTFSFLLRNPNSTNTLPSNHTRAIYLDSKGQIWIGTDYSGLSIYNPLTNRFDNLGNDPRDPSTLSNNRINYFFEDRNHFMWVGTENGLNKYVPETRKFVRYLNNPQNPNSLCNNNIYNIFQDSEGLIWISTLGGISCFNPSNEKFYTLKRNPNASTNISSNKIFCVYEDNDHILWVATCGGGLNRIDRKTGEIKYYLEKDGLANNVVYNIFEDKNYNLWITTNYGLSRFDKDNESFVNFDATDGIQSNEFNGNACFYNQKTGKLFVGGMNGFNMFQPEKIFENKYIPHVVISNVLVLDHLLNKEIRDGDTLILNWDENFFTFQFAALDYANPSKNKFAYILQNYNKKWITSGVFKHIASYTKVDPGSYSLKIMGSNADGFWNQKGITVTIIILTPWWQTWWFRLLVVLVIISVAAIIVWNRIRTVRMKHEQEKKILEIEKQMFSLEQTALRLQMNPHFIFNSLNSIQSFVIANDTDKAIHYLAKFSQLMRFILSHSQQTFVPLQDEIKSMSIYLDIEQLRFNNKFTYSFYIDPMLDPEFIEIPPMIIQPYIENAILHGILNKEGLGVIQISISQVDEKYLLCTVQDDGVGREMAERIKARSDLHHKSRGMLITQKRLALLNNRDENLLNVNIIDLKDESEKPTGTRVEILLIFNES
jgi:ligand-binding sensor domain-containing protein/sensor histidine kinase YesM